MEKFRLHLFNLIKMSKAQPSIINICLGNVSADMDSVVGSMALSYYYFLKHNINYIPVINLRKSEL